MWFATIEFAGERGLIPMVPTCERLLQTTILRSPDWQRRHDLLSSVSRRVTTKT